MSIELWIALIGLATAVIGAWRWLLEVIHKNKMKEDSDKADKAKELEHLRAQNNKLTQSNIEIKIEHIETMINALREDVQQARLSIEKISDKVNKNDDVFNNIQKYMTSRDAQIKQFSSMILKLNDELILIKGKKNGS